MGIDLGFSGNRQTQSGTSGVDATTASRMGNIWQYGQQAGNSGPGGLINGAGGYNTQAMGAGQLGMAAMAGNPWAAQQLMNPYQQQVVDANNAQWQKTNQQTMNATDDRATQAGAFGGSRHGVAEGVALGNNNLAQMNQNAGLLYQGYNGAMGQAQQMAQMGMQGSQQNAQLGFAGVGNDALWRMNMAKQGYMGPTGQQYQNSQSQTQGGLSFGLF